MNSSEKINLKSNGFTQYQNNDSLIKDKKNHKHTINQIIYLGVFFLLLTLTYSSFSTIITYIYQQHERYQYLGPLLLLTNYGTFMLCNLLAPFIKVSYKKQLIIGATCYSINYGLEIPVILDPLGIFLLIFGSILGGLGAAIVWVSQGGFMTKLFQKYQRPNDYHGRYFGILNMVVFSNILWGSIITTFGLGFMGDTDYFIILTFIGVISIGFGTFFLEDVQAKNQFEQKLQQQISQQSQILINQNKKTKFSLKRLLFRNDMNLKINVIQLYDFSKKMKNYIPIIITDGFILGLISSSATHFLPLNHYSKVQTGIFLILLGTGAIFGGFLSGFLTDKIQIMKVGKSSILVLAICIFLSLPLFMELILNFVYSYFLGFAWGFGWHYLDGWLWVICSKSFEGKLQSFALNKFIHSFSFVIYQMAIILYGRDDSLAFIEYFLIFLTVLLILSLFFLIKEQKEKKFTKISTK